MRVRIFAFSCLIVLFNISSPIVSAQTQYKIYFNNIVCLNPRNNSINTGWLSLTYPVNAEFINAAIGEPPNPEPLKYIYTSNTGYGPAGDFARDGKTETKYFSIKYRSKS